MEAHNITIELTRDAQAVWKIITDPAVFARICDDEWLKKPIYELQAIVRGIVANPDNLIPLVLMDGKPVGCFLACQIADGVLEIHTCLTKALRGHLAIDAGQRATRLLFSHSHAETLVSNCPACLPEAYWFAKKVGWQNAGISENQWIRNGTPYAITKVEAKKADWQPPGPLVPTKDQVEALEARLLPYSQDDCPLRHMFAPGVYLRTIFMAKGKFIIGHEHKTEHFNIILKGAARVLIDGMVTEIRAPNIFVSKPGVRKVLEIIEDMEWATVHPTDETDLEKITDIVIKKSNSFLKYQAEIEALKTLTPKGQLHEA